MMSQHPVSISDTVKHFARVNQYPRTTYTSVLCTTPAPLDRSAAVPKLDLIFNVRVPNRKPYSTLQQPPIVITTRRFSFRFKIHEFNAGELKPEY